MKVIDSKFTIAHNRGAKGNLRLLATKAPFKVDDVIKFSIVTKNNYEDVVFQKEFKITEECTEYVLQFTKDEMRIGDPISKKVEYYYEIELNDDTTLLGSFTDGDKRFVLYPEAGTKKEVDG